MITGTCSQCLYGQGFLNAMQGASVRLCRFSPPSALVAQNPIGQGRLWPQVQDNDWCADGVNATTGIPFSQVIPQFTVVAKLPVATPQLAGARTFVTDAVTGHSVGSALTGGGTLTMPVYCSGTAWLAG